ncbi:putative enzyme related to lactoylglutathione lyase [Lipingzhangella halophila]|uniref:Putative enzyme related to lactoylglutathione lyase n=1 Tax=Lipingzhangella halophila TaxID=1783352 RepID=A0A7W7W4Y5_9ACTN|nr:VOC family protein [Lipingzhangella halophila]MBB4934291.1 putative enzyme related to lactoylglutathione lyase [Lipingzhangella halophila]
MRCSYIRLLVNDYVASFRFYRDVMKLPVLWGSEITRYAEFDVYSPTRLALNEREVMAEALGTIEKDAALPGQDRVSVIFEVDDVDHSAAELVAAGAPQVSPPKDWSAWGIRAAHFRDPDGYLLEINRPLVPET